MVSTDTASTPTRTSKRQKTTPTSYSVFDAFPPLEAFEYDPSAIIPGTDEDSSALSPRPDSPSIADDRAAGDAHSSETEEEDDTSAVPRMYRIPGVVWTVTACPPGTEKFDVEKYWLMKGLEPPNRRRKSEGASGKGTPRTDSTRKRLSLAALLGRKRPAPSGTPDTSASASPSTGLGVKTAAGSTPRGLIKKKGFRPNFKNGHPRKRLKSSGTPTSSVPSALGSEDELQDPKTPLKRGSEKGKAVSVDSAMDLDMPGSRIDNMVKPSSAMLSNKVQPVDATPPITTLAEFEEAFKAHGHELEAVFDDLSDVEGEYLDNAGLLALPPSPVKHKKTKAASTTLKSSKGPAIHAFYSRLKGTQDRTFITHAEPYRMFNNGSSDFVGSDFSQDNKHFALCTSVLTDMYNRDGNLVLGSVDRDTVYFLDGHKSRNPNAVQGGNGLVHNEYLWQTVTDVKFVHGGKYLCSGGYDNTVRVWDVEDRKQTHVVDTKTNVLVMGGHPFRDMIATALKEPEIGIAGSVRLFEISDAGKAKKLIDLDPGPKKGNFQPACIAFSPNGQSLVSGYIGANQHKRWGGIMTYDVATGERKADFLYSSSAHTDVFWHPSGIIVAGSTPRKQLRPPIRSLVRLLKEGIKHPFMELPTPQYDINNVSMSPSGTYITSAGTDNVVMVWDIRQSRTPVQQLEHEMSIHQIIIQETETRSRLSFRERNDEGVCGVIWESDTTLMSGGTDGKVKAWDLRRNGEDAFIKDVCVMDSCVTVFKKSPDESMLVVGDGAGHMKLLNTQKMDYDKPPHYMVVR